MADVDTSTGAQKVGSPQPEQSSAPTASTPPPSSTQQQSQQQTSTQSSSQQQQQQQQSQQAAGATQTSDNGPSSSLNDPGTSTRPHDARTIHMILASLGVTAYQERVPLQLLDFAYRYTSSVLSDAQHLAAEGYVSSASGSGGGGGKGAAGTAGDQIPLAALRLATSSRLGYQFSSSLPKQTMLDLAKERNKIALPDPGEKLVFGLNLPHERFVQTGTNWTMLEEWDSEEAAREEDAVNPAPGDGENGTAVTNGGDAGDAGDDKDEDMEDGYDAVFGGDEEDKTMEES